MVIGSDRRSEKCTNWRHVSGRHRHMPSRQLASWVTCSQPSLQTQTSWLQYVT